ncbi:MAG: hypothetical protein WC538_21445 [Thermoanaerobaculia bacterium]|jgi:hypothetical protein
MRRILMIAAIGLLSVQALALPQEGANPREREWVRRAPLSANLLEKALAEANSLEATGHRPIVLTETNYYALLPGEPLELRVTVDPNGFGAPVTMYLYRENRTTGERRYYQASGTELAAGVQSDLFGSAEGGPVPVFVPKLSDFVLFGSAAGGQLNFGSAGTLGPAITVPSGQPGLHQFVFELRDVVGKRIVSRSNAMYSYVTASESVTGTLSGSKHWTADTRYVLHDYVGVPSGITLTIDPGTVIYGGDGRATLFIQRGAKIIADGTARRPITFTSAQRTGLRAQKDWGSLVLLGKAPINVAGGQAFLEGLPSSPEYAFGGTDPADSSGIVRYVRLEFGGFEIATAQEINGLTLGGVGNGTIIDHVEVLHNKDDAFEFFGGTVNASHLLGVAFADDGLDFDFGFSGSVQFAAMIKRAENDESDSNIYTESDNNATGGSETPLTNPQVYNVTSVRVPSNTGNYGGVIRRNSAGKHYNAVVRGSKNAPMNVRDASTNNNANSGALVLDYSILFGDFSDAAFPSRTDGEQSRTFVFTTNKHNRNTDPKLAIGTPSLLKTLMPDLTPLSDSPALDADFVAVPPDNGFLKAVDYQGAVAPGNNWILSGWATFSDN